MTTAAALSPHATIVVAFLAAAFGCFLATALQAYVNRQGSRKHFQAMIRALQLEIEVIASEAADRASRARQDLRLDPPYPALAWKTLTSTPEARRLGDTYAPLAELYRAVDAANHRLSQVSILLEISVVAPTDDLRLQYRDLAQNFSGPANSEVATASDAAKLAVARVRGALPRSDHALPRSDSARLGAR
jgi:hypothetical protein